MGNSANRPRRRIAPTIIGLIAILAALLPQGVTADTTHSHMVVHGTIGSFSLNPNLNMTFAVNTSTVIPSDTLTYPGTVTHTGITACLPGTVTAQNTGGATGTITDFFDEIDTWDPNQLKWVPLAGVAFTQTAFVPVVTPLISTGITLTVTSVPATGVTYPTSGNPIIGTTIAPNATAAWNGTACITLSAAQLQTLANAPSIQVEEHFEDTPGDVGEAWTDVQQSPSPFNLSVLAAKNVTVTVTPPSGPALQITSTQVPAFSSLAVGASASYSTTYKVLPVAAKGAGETDAAYLTRLGGVEGSTLAARATVSATGPTGPVTSSSAPVSTTEHVPVVTITKTGPATTFAGTNEINPLALKNSGGAIASNLTVADSVPSGGTGTVSGLPLTLGPGVSTTNTQVIFPVPVTQSQGNLTDTATLSWQDANANTYGIVSSSFTTVVQNQLLGASFTLGLPPGAAGVAPIGASQTVVVTLLTSGGTPISGQAVTVSITGVNPTILSAVTDTGGHANLSYSGSNPGTDQLQASATSGPTTVLSNTLALTWAAMAQPVSFSPIQGNFYAINSVFGIAINPSSPATFAQTFPNLTFNPPPDVVAHNPSTVNALSNGFTDVTTDVGGNFSGTIVAQGNDAQGVLHVPGGGDMAYFQAAFLGTMTVRDPGQVALQVYAAGAMMMGVGGGATSVRGTGDPYQLAGSALKNYPVMGSRNKDQPLIAINFVVNFPAAGSYPFEVDYADCCSLRVLTLRAEPLTPSDPTGLTVYAGYAETHTGGGFTPTPWQGSPNVNFIGSVQSFGWDSGAVRIDNAAASPVTLDQVSVDVGSQHFNLWGSNLVVPAKGSLILTQVGDQTFDTSDVNFTPSCPIGAAIPVIHVKLAGVIRNYPDVNQILNTGGRDLAVCTGVNESQNWSAVPFSPGGMAPVGPAQTLLLSPSTVSGDTVGQTQAFTITSMDANGNVVPNLPVALTVSGSNGGQLPGTTDANGLLTLNYVGLNPGTDNVQASGSINGVRTVSNVVAVPWALAPISPTVQAAPPSITEPTPVDGSIVTKPVPVSATITPPAGQTIASWSVSYQAQDPEPAVALATGTGAPPSTLATFDPTLLPNDTYAITVSATGSSGGTQTVTTTVAVFGNLKLGRYVTTYQDLNVPVNGFQMQVRRVYDSIDKRVGDFGVGWHVDLTNFRVSANRQLGAGGWTLYPTQCIFGLCFYAFKTSAPHFITVTFPDGHQEIFDFTPSAGAALLYWQGSAAFTARPGTGTTSKLEVAGDTSLSYDFAGNLTGAVGFYNPTRFKLTTHDGRVLILDTMLGLVSETDRNGNSLTVDANGVHASNGQSITYTRDSVGRITQIAGPVAGELLQYGYSPQGDLASHIDGNKNVTTFSYDANHDLLATKGPGAAPFQTLQYDLSGRLIAITDASNNTTKVTTNLAAQQQTITDPNGALTTLYTYDDLGDNTEVDQIAAGKTLTTKFGYDSVGRLTSEQDPLLNSVQLVYDANGNLTSTTDALHNTYRFTYDQFGNPLTEVAPDGSPTFTLSYDSAGNLLQVQRADGKSTFFVYDSAGHLTQVTDPAGRIIRLAYDAAGHLASSTNSVGQALFSINAAGQLVALTDPLGDTTTYAYDGNGNLSQITDASKRTQKYGFDYFGNVVSYTDALGITSTYQRDVSGRLLLSTDRDGRTTKYGYDVDGNLVSQQPSVGEATSYSYDPFSRVTAASTPTSAIQFGYDDAGNLTSHNTSGAGLPTVGMTYRYDAGNRLIAETGPDGTTSYGYDANSRLTSVGVPGATTNYALAYNAIDLVTGISHPNGIKESLAYNAAGDLTSRKAASATATVGQLDYTYDSVGRTSSLTDSLGMRSYTYDADGQVTAATQPSGSPIANEAYSYDAVGNRIGGQGSAPVYDADNRLLSDSVFTYAYDNEGNLKSKTSRATGATTSFDWDANHELLAIHYPGGTSSTYQYDPLGRRIGVTDPSAVTHYVWDGSNIRYEYGGANTLSASYYNMQALGGVLAMSRGVQTYDYLKDALGSTVALADSSGTIVQTYQYASFGQPSSSGSLANPFTFTGHQYDAASGLFYARARYYAPTTGRFLSQDPVASINPYPYAKNDPTNLVDPTGAEAAPEYGINTSTRAATQADVLTEIEDALCTGLGSFRTALNLAMGAGADGLPDPNASGRAAEDHVGGWLGVPKNTKGIPVGNTSRIPDFVYKGKIVEVKNALVLKARDIAQIRDFTQITNSKVVLVLRRSFGALPRTLQVLENSGALKVLRCLPG